MTNSSEITLEAETLDVEERFVPAVLAGLAAALLGAVVWAAVTVSTKYQIGFMAVGVGFVVGSAVRVVGHGTTNRFAGAGALLALFGCLLGNLLSACGFAAAQESISIWSILGQMNTSLAIELMSATFQPMDLLFYGIAVAEGAKLSLKK